MLSNPAQLKRFATGLYKNGHTLHQIEVLLGYKLDIDNG